MKKEMDLSKAHMLSYPSLATLITVKDNIITLAWQTTLSFDPPMYGIAVAPERFSHSLLMEAKEFGVNFITTDYLKELLFCGTSSGRDVNKFEETGLTKERATEIGSFLIGEAIGNIECTIVNTLEVGDHTLFAGEIVAANAEEDYLDNMLKYKKPYNMGRKHFVKMSEDMLTIG